MTNHSKKEFFLLPAVYRDQIFKYTFKFLLVVIEANVQEHCASKLHEVPLSPAVE